MNFLSPVLRIMNLCFSDSRPKSREEEEEEEEEDGERERDL